MVKVYDLNSEEFQKKFDYRTRKRPHTLFLDPVDFHHLGQMTETLTDLLLLNNLLETPIDERTHKPPSILFGDTLTSEDINVVSKALAYARRRAREEKEAVRGDVLTDPPPVSTLLQITHALGKGRAR